MRGSMCCSGGEAFLLRADDLWLAASALRLDVPLVTRNTRELGKVPGIKLDPFLTRAREVPTDSRKRESGL